MFYSKVICANVRGHIRSAEKKCFITVYGAVCNLLLLLPGSFDVSSFADRLWGDIYFDETTRRFSRKAADPESPRTFVHFILEPLYKLYSQVLSEDTANLKGTLESLGIILKPVMYKMDVRPLLKAVLDQFFGKATGFVDMIVEHIPSPVQGTAQKVRRLNMYIYEFSDEKSFFGS